VLGHKTCYTCKHDKPIKPYLRMFHGLLLVYLSGEFVDADMSLARFVPGALYEQLVYHLLIHPAPVLVSVSSRM
jgi:hypothetical protein